MATRPAFYLEKGYVTSKNADFEWAGGFAISQKRKNIARLHEALGQQCLEVSTKSTLALGQKLSAFNLKLNGKTLENVFQSSKVFAQGGPYVDLLDVPPKMAKRDERLKNSGELISFKYDNHTWKLTPKTCFYDYIYYKAVKESIPESELIQIKSFEFFTDIEFNPKKGINTQARAIVLVKLMLQLWGELIDLTPEEFYEFHSKFVKY